MSHAVYRRYLWTIVSTAALFAVADALLLPFSSIYLDSRGARVLAGQVIFGGAFLVLGKFMQMVASRSGGMLRDVLELVSAGLINIGIFLVLFFLFAGAGCLFMYLAAATSRPLMDADLAAVDRALGFNWLKIVALANSSTWLASIMVFCYATINYQIGLAAMFHVLTNNRDRLFQFGAIMAVSLLLTYAIMIGIPCEGAYALYRPAPSSFSNFTAIGGLAHLSTLARLRSLEPFDFILGGTVGLTCFPSFHTALGVMTVHALRRTVLFFPMTVVAAIMIAATIPQGGHYLVDVIAGACVAVISIGIVELIGRWAASPLASGDDGRSAASFK
jgi:hypothetical protein